MWMPSARRDGRTGCAIVLSHPSSTKRSKDGAPSVVVERAMEKLGCDTRPKASNWTIVQGWSTKALLVSGALLSLAATVGWANETREQTVFDADPSVPIVRPIALPNGAAQILAKDDNVVACMKDNPIPQAASLASWFTASEIHLNGPNEADLVVLPAAQNSPFICFHSVEGIGWFWVFRQIGGRYELVLKTAGLGLTVLESRHSGYRDILSGGQVGAFATQSSFRFENGRYREHQRKTEKLP
jgi:hypothetical protein